MRFINIRVAVLGGALALGGLACTPTSPGQMLPDLGGDSSPTGKPRCLDTLVTFMYGEEMRCDVQSGQQLNIVFDDRHHDAWGGDASVQWAAGECDAMGGTQVWVQNPYRLICENIDY